MTIESFDLFDTLVTRTTLSPIEVFRLIGAGECTQYRWRMLRSIPFYKWRRLAERIARRLSSKEDIRLSDIYRVLGVILRNPASVMRKEIAVEITCIRPIEEMICRYRRLVRSGANTCIISDMYLPSTVLRKILNKHVGPSKLYASSDFGLTKTSGNLFRFVSKDLEVGLSNFHHYGDNPVSDYVVPKNLGMKATLVDRLTQRCPINFLDSFKNPVNDDPLFEIGFDIAGPTAFIMAACLATQVRRAQPPNIVFAARDMHLIKYAFDKISDYKKTSYCRISRSAVYRAKWHANPSPWQWFEGTTNGQQLFTRLGLQCPEELKHVNPYAHCSQILYAVSKTNFFEDCKNSFELMSNYLKSQGFGKNTLFVDLGWRGSTQDAVNDILPNNEHIYGWYFGTFSKDSNKFGLYFNNKNNRRRFYRVTQAISFFEFCFTEAVPSISSIRQDETAFEFVFTDDETAAQIETRKRIIDGARCYIDYMCDVYTQSPFRTVDMLNALDAIYDCHLRHPCERWVQAMDTMTHSGGFGGSGTSSMVGDSSGTPLGFLKAPWKGGYLVKHKSSRWLPIMRLLDHTVVFVLYDFAKECVHSLRRIKVTRASQR